METLEHKFCAYLAKATGQAVVLQPMSGVALPQHLQRQYAIYTASLPPVTLTVVMLLVPEAFSPTRFRQHLPQLVGHDHRMTCLVAEQMPGYVRQRLMEAQQPFVVPGVQLYLPMLGMEWRQRAARKPVRVGQVFAPATQALLVYLLQKPGRDGMTPLVLAQHLGYSSMTMSRAISELEAAGMGRVVRAGRERRVSLAHSNREVWQQALGFIATPVLQQVRVRMDAVNVKALPKAGETALASMTLLAEPPIPCYAVSRAWWQHHAPNLEQIPVDEPGTCVLQIWSYDPQLLSSADTVDPFSLYASLQDEPDERVEQALAELMEHSSWSEGSQSFVSTSQVSTSTTP